MRAPRDISGLIKFLTRDDWKSRLEDVLGEHFRPAMEAFDLEYDEIGAALGGGWDMTLWGVAFEDFLGREFAADGRNFVEEYLRRHGWNESAPAKAFMRALRNSILSLYEVSAIVPGESFLARDLIRGGEPVLVSEHTATRTLAEWDRIAARIVVQGRKRILTGGLLGFPFETSERLMAELQRTAGRSGTAVRSTRKQPIADDELRGMAPHFTAIWLLDALPKALGLSRPTVQNSDGDEVVFHEVRFPLAAKATSDEVADRLDAIASLHRENDTFWNWLADPTPPHPQRRNADAENVMAYNVTIQDGRTVLGNVEIKERTLVVSVNSAARAERATAMLRTARGEIVAAPLAQIQSIDQMLAQHQDRPRPASDILLEVQTKLVHQSLDRQYRALLGQPVPMLGDVTPRAAARTAAGREKLAV